MSTPEIESTDARFEHLRPRTRSTRRRLVVAFALAVVLTAVAGSLPDAPILTLLGILTALGLGAILRWSIHSSADLPDDQLDERLIRDRDSAYLATYQLIATLLVVIVVGADMALPWLERSGGTLADAGRVTGALMPSIPPLVLFTPSAVLAWRRTEV